MPDLPGTPSSITCAACGFENATTSLYCQDCGVRLVAPPTAIEETPAPEASGTGSVVTVRKKKPRILSAHREKRAAPFLVITVRAVVLAAIAAPVILLLREPAGLPPAAAPLPADVIGNIRNGLAHNAQTIRPVTMPWSGQGLNAFLAGVVPTVHSGLSARVAPAGAGFTLFVRHRIGAISIYTTSTFRLVLRGNGINLQRVSATVGRLAVPSWALPAMNWADEGVAQALAPELGILRNAAAVQIDNRQVRVVFAHPAP